MQSLKASFLRHGAGVSILMFLLCVSLWGQNISSSLKGALVDRTGASIPGALCTLTNEAANAGAYNAARSPRIIQLSLKLFF